MAVTVTTQNFAAPGASIAKTVAVALDSSYPNPAGYVLTPATFGFNVLRRIVYAAAATLAAGAYEPVLIPTYSTDQANGTQIITSVALHLIVGSTGVEVANAVNVSTSTLTFIVEGN